MSRLLELSTGCRLHFGLLELAEGQPHRYGGLGLMLEAPKLHLRYHSSPTSAVHLSPSLEVERRILLAMSHASALLATHYRLDEGALQGSIEVVACPPLHSGLGVGTQLAAAVAELMFLATQELVGSEQVFSSDPVADLAWLSGRGKRSAIGLHGFLNGGLIRDLGYDEGQSPGQGTARPIHTLGVALPPAWSVVLCCSNAAGEVHGALEEHLIGRAAAQPNPHRDRMLTLSDMALKTAQIDDFAGFTESLDEYMELAALLFESVQGGKYRDLPTAQRVEQMQAVGLSGVGQSSWGPTVFGFAPDHAHAQAAADRLTEMLKSDNYHVLVAKPKVGGAVTSMSTTGGRQHAG